MVTICTDRNHLRDTPFYVDRRLDTDDYGRKHIYIIFFLVWLLSILSSKTLANDELFANEYNSNIVLSASRLKQSVTESPSSITVIDKETIKQSGARSIIDLLLLVPGMQTGRLTNGDPVATYHGQAHRYNPQIQLIINNRPTYVPLYGGIPWGELPITLSSIERIEVNRAPNAATFGPNSFSSVISITTKDPAIEPSWFHELEFGGNEHLTSTLTFSKNIDDVSNVFTLRYERDEGFKNIEDRERAKMVSYRSTNQLDKATSLNFDIAILDGSHIETDRVEGNYISPNEENYNGYFQIELEKAASTDDTNTLRYYYNYFEIRDSSIFSFDAGALLDNPDLTGIELQLDLDRDARSERHEIEYTKTRRITPNHKIAIGGALRRDSVQGRYIFSNDRSHHINTARLFAHSYLEANNVFSINNGILLEDNDLNGFTVSPRTSLNVKLDSHNFFRFGYSRGVRSPLLLEEKGRVEFNATVNGEELKDIIIFDNKKLKPEIADVFDVAYIYKNKRRGLLFDAKLSYRKVKSEVHTIRDRDFIEDTLDGNARYYDNDVPWSMRNIEFGLEWILRNRMSFRGVYSRAFDLHPPEHEDLSPPIHTVGLFAGTKFSNGFSLSSEFYYTSKWSWNDARVSEPSKLRRLDFRLSKESQIGNLLAEFSIQAELRLGDNLDYLPRNKVTDLYFLKYSLKFP